MRWNGRARHIAKALAAGALLGLAGCQQLPHQGARLSALGWRNEPKVDGPVTPAQEADVQISLGRIAEQQGDLDQAMAAYRAAIAGDKRRADALVRMAIVNDKKGKFRESAELYKKALQQRPGDPDIFCDMGYSLYLQRRWSESEMNLRQAIAASPEFPRAHNNLALLLVRDNRLEDALAEFRKAGSTAAQSHLNLAFALTMEQRWGPAREEYQRALSLDPSSEIAKARLGQLNTLLAKLESRRNPAAEMKDTQMVMTSATVPEARPRSVTRAVSAAPQPSTDRAAASSSPPGGPAAGENAAWLAQLEAEGRWASRDVSPILPPNRFAPRRHPQASAAAPNPVPASRPMAPAPQPEPEPDPARGPRTPEPLLPVDLSTATVPPVPPPPPSHPALPAPRSRPIPPPRDFPDKADAPGTTGAAGKMDPSAPSAGS